MHGLSKTRLYSIFSGMKQRCYNENDSHYKWYGAKGVTICQEWLGEDGLAKFIEWALNNGYQEHLSIDRIDSSGPYSPENCRWVTASLNSMFAHRNICTDSVYMDISKKIRAAEGYAGISEAELARRLGKSSQALGQRIKTGKFKLEKLEEMAKAMGAELVCVFLFPDGTEI